MKFSFFFICLLAIAGTVTAQRADSLINKAAPPVQFQYTTGKHANKDFYKGKVLVLDFWATWCAPCIANFPHFNKLADAFQSKDVVFAITSDEPLKRVQRFFERTKKEVHALSLVDTTKKTMNDFKIDFIPYSVVIDKNNIVRWTGSGERLTDSILSAIIKNETLPGHAVPMASESAKSTALQKKPVKLTPAFSFSVTFSDTTTKGSPGGGSSSYNGDYIDYSTRNEQLGTVLASITGFGRKARIITNDTTKLNRLIDVNFSTPYHGKFDTVLLKRYSNILLPGKPRKNMVVSLLGDALKFDAKTSRVTKDYYELVVADSAKLHTFMSMQKGHASFSDDYFPKFEIVGYTLKHITMELENSAKMIITTVIADENSYDLSLDISNIKTLQQTLAFHGLALKPVNGEVEVLNINFY